MSNDLGTILQMRELTASDKAVLWNNYQKAMVSNGGIKGRLQKLCACRDRGCNSDVNGCASFECEGTQSPAS